MPPKKLADVCLQLNMWWTEAYGKCQREGRSNGAKKQQLFFACPLSLFPRMLLKWSDSVNRGIWPGCAAGGAVTLRVGWHCPILSMLQAASGKGITLCPASSFILDQTSLIPHSWLTQNVPGWITKCHPSCTALCHHKKYTSLTWHVNSRKLF